MKLLILGAAALILIAGRCVLAQPAAMSDCGCNGENCEGWKFQEGATTLNKWNPGVYPPNGFKITATPADCRKFCMTTFDEDEYPTTEYPDGKVKATYFAWVNDTWAAGDGLQNACFCRTESSVEATAEKSVTTYRIGGCPCKLTQIIFHFD